MSQQNDQGFIDALVEEEIHLRRFGNVSEGQSHLQQQDIDTQWDQDRQSLSFATSSLKKTDFLTEKMVRQIRRFRTSAILFCGSSNSARYN
jgi:hypothetical protein